MADNVSLIEYADVKTYENILQKFNLVQEELLWCPANEALRKRTEQKSTVIMPFCNLWRTGMSNNRARFNNPLAVDGMIYTLYDDDGNKHDNFIKLKIFPTTYSYQLDSWSFDIRYQNEKNSAYIEWWDTSPIIDFNQVPPPEGYGQEWHWRVRYNDPVDNSMIDQEYELGRIFRTTYTFDIDGVVTKLSDSLRALFKVNLRIYDN